MRPQLWVTRPCRSPCTTTESTGAQAAGAVAFNRSPRLDPRYVGIELKAPEPPKPAQRQRFPIVTLIAPIMMAGMIYAITQERDGDSLRCVEPADDDRRLAREPDGQQEGAGACHGQLQVGAGRSVGAAAVRRRPGTRRTATRTPVGDGTRTGSPRPDPARVDEAARTRVVPAAPSRPRNADESKHGRAPERQRHPARTLARTE